jgi:cyanobactin maturation PatA/PatG family protease
MSRRPISEAIPGLAALRQRTHGIESVVIAIVDGDVDLGHPAFANARQRLRRLDTMASGGEASKHGTHVTSVLFGEAEKMAGIALGCRGIVLPVFPQRADGSLGTCSQTDLARAIGQAVDAGAHVINISGGQLVEAGAASDFLAQAVRGAAEENVLIVAAVGNEGCECLHVPAALPNVLAVGGLDRAGRSLPMSNWGGPLAAQGVTTLGEEVLGAVPGGGYERLTGTSFATPIVAGVAALLISRQIELGQRPDPLAVRQAILGSARTCDPQRVDDCHRALAGNLDVAGAHRTIAPDDFAPTAELSSVNPTTREENMMESHPAGQTAPSQSVPAEAVPAEAVPAEAVPTQATPMYAVPSATSPIPVTPSAVAPSCGCGRGGGQLVFALGNLYYDFGTDARRDYFISQVAPTQPWKVNDPKVMAEYLGHPEGGGNYHESLFGDAAGKKSHPEDANALIWTLFIDQDPVYAIVPEDQYAMSSYMYLTNFLWDQTHAAELGNDQPDVEEATVQQDDVFRVSIGGRISGRARLFNGEVIPTIAPVTRGMYDWSITELVKSLDVEPGSEDHQELKNFLERIYFELRNLGTAGRERAVNFAATNAFQASTIIRDALKENLRLDGIRVARSPICRRDSECWDVSVQFFDPERVFDKARKVYMYTIDVSDVVPVQVGKMRSWYVFSDPFSK